MPRIFEKLTKDIETFINSMNFKDIDEQNHAQLKIVLRGCYEHLKSHKTSIEERFLYLMISKIVSEEKIISLIENIRNIVNDETNPFNLDDNKKTELLFSTVRNSIYTTHDNKRDPLFLALISGKTSVFKFLINDLKFGICFQINAQNFKNQPDSVPLKTIIKYFSNSNYSWINQFTLEDIITLSTKFPDTFGSLLQLKLKSLPSKESTSGFSNKLIEHILFIKDHEIKEKFLTTCQQLLPFSDCHLNNIILVFFSKLNFLLNQSKTLKTYFLPLYSDHYPLEKEEMERKIHHEIVSHPTYSYILTNELFLAIAKMINTKNLHEVHYRLFFCSYKQDNLQTYELSFFEIINQSILKYRKDNSVDPNEIKELEIFSQNLKNNNDYPFDTSSMSAYLTDAIYNDQGHYFLLYAKSAIADFTNSTSVLKKLIHKSTIIENSNNNAVGSSSSQNMVDYNFKITILNYLSTLNMTTHLLRSYTIIDFLKVLFLQQEEKNNLERIIITLKFYNIVSPSIIIKQLPVPENETAQHADGLLNEYSLKIISFFNKEIIDSLKKLINDFSRQDNIQEKVFINTCCDFFNSLIYPLQHDHPYNFEEIFQYCFKLLSNMTIATNIESINHFAPVVKFAILIIEKLMFNFPEKIFITDIISNALFFIGTFMTECHRLGLEFSKVISSDHWIALLSCLLNMHKNNKDWGIKIDTQNIIENLIKHFETTNTKIDAPCLSSAVITENEDWVKRLSALLNAAYPGTERRLRFYQKQFVLSPMSYAIILKKNQFLKFLAPYYKLEDPIFLFRQNFEIDPTNPCRSHDEFNNYSHLSYAIIISTVDLLNDLTNCYTPHHQYFAFTFSADYSLDLHSHRFLTPLITCILRHSSHDNEDSRSMFEWTFKKIFDLQHLSVNFIEDFIASKDYSFIHALLQQKGNLTLPLIKTIFEKLRKNSIDHPGHIEKLITIINTPGTKTFTPLQIAIEYNLKDTVAWLLENKISVTTNNIMNDNAQNTPSFSPLGLAVNNIKNNIEENSNQISIDILKIMLGSSLFTLESKKEAILLAYYYNLPEILGILLESAPVYSLQTCIKRQTFNVNTNTNIDLIIDFIVGASSLQFNHPLRRCIVKYSDRFIPENILSTLLKFCQNSSHESQQQIREFLKEPIIIKVPGYKKMREHVRGLLKNCESKIDNDILLKFQLWHDIIYPICPLLVYNTSSYIKQMRGMSHALALFNLESLLNLDNSKQLQLNVPSEAENELFTKLKKFFQVENADNIVQNTVLLKEKLPKIFIQETEESCLQYMLNILPKLQLDEAYNHIDLIRIYVEYTPADQLFTHQDKRGNTFIHNIIQYDVEVKDNKITNDLLSNKGALYQTLIEKFNSWQSEIKEKYSSLDDKLIELLHQQNNGGIRPITVAFKGKEELIKSILNFCIPKSGSSENTTLELYGSLLNECVELLPNNATPLINLADIFLDRGEFLYVWMILKIVPQQSPEFVKACNNIALLFNNYLLIPISEQKIQDVDQYNVLNSDTFSNENEQNYFIVKGGDNVTEEEKSLARKQGLIYTFRALEAQNTAETFALVIRSTLFIIDPNLIRGMPVELNIKNGSLRPVLDLLNTAKNNYTNSIQSSSNSKQPSQDGSAATNPNGFLSLKRKHEEDLGNPSKEARHN